MQSELRKMSKTSNNSTKYPMEINGKKNYNIKKDIIVLFLLVGDKPFLMNIKIKEEKCDSRI